MRERLVGICALVVAMLAPYAVLAQMPADTLIGGQVQSAFQRSGATWCYVGQGASEFQRNGTNSTAIISFPEVVYFDGNYHPLNGQARLTFASATDGTVKFKFWGTSSPINSPGFSNYSETFNGQQYIISFTIAFPNGCSLPIFAGYETP